MHTFPGDYYKPRLIEGLEAISPDVISQISREIEKVIRREGRIFAFGNGGSEAIAEHLLYTIEDEISDEYQFDTYGNPKTNTPIDQLFNPRIKRSARPGDLVFLISASGNSKNINEACRLCREMDIRTISISGQGEVAEISDFPVVIPSKDQQISEDIAQALIHAAVRADLDYPDKIQDGLVSIIDSQVHEIASDVFDAFQSGNTVRIDAPDSAAISISAGHTTHNFKWDAFQGAEKRLSNNVNTGLLSYHLTGVSNDGGEDFNLAVEIDDNGQENDVEIVFAMDLEDLRVQRVIKVARRKLMNVHPVCFNTESEDIAADLTQITGHILGRILNTMITGSDLESDLALLRVRCKTRQELTAKYKCK